MKNLKKEMAAEKVTIDDIAEALTIHRNSASNKVNGKYSFTIEEAFLIRDVFFPKMTLEYLFTKDNAGENRKGT